MKIQKTKLKRTCMEFKSNLLTEGESNQRQTKGKAFEKVAGNCKQGVKSEDCSLL